MSRRHAKARPCPNATKTAYPTKVAADAGLAAILADPQPWREKKPARSYLCRCQHWHLTSRPLRAVTYIDADGQGRTTG